MILKEEEEKILKNRKINKRRGGRSKKNPRGCSDVWEVNTLDGGVYFEIATLRCMNIDLVYVFLLCVIDINLY